MLLDQYNGDNLIATNAHTATTQTVEIAPGQDVMDRGSVLVRNSNNRFELLSASSASAAKKAEVILASDLLEASTASAVKVAEVYNSGDFNESALKMDGEYTLSEADRLNLKNAGIYVINGLD